MKRDYAQELKSHIEDWFAENTEVQWNTSFDVRDNTDSFERHIKFEFYAQAIIPLDLGTRK